MPRSVVSTTSAERAAVAVLANQLPAAVLPLPGAHIQVHFADPGWWYNDRFDLQALVLDPQEANAQLAADHAAAAAAKESARARARANGEDVEDEDAPAFVPLGDDEFGARMLMDDADNRFTVMRFRLREQHRDWSQTPDNEATRLHDLIEQTKNHACAGNRYNECRDLHVKCRDQLQDGRTLAFDIKVDKNGRIAARLHSLHVDNVRYLSGHDSTWESVAEFIDAGCHGQPSARQARNRGAAAPANSLDGGAGIAASTGASGRLQADEHGEPTDNEEDLLNSQPTGDSDDGQRADTVAPGTIAPNGFGEVLAEDAVEQAEAEHQAAVNEVAARERTLQAYVTTFVEGVQAAAQLPPRECSAEIGRLNEGRQAADDHLNEATQALAHLAGRVALVRRAYDAQHLRHHWVGRVDRCAQRLKRAFQEADPLALDDVWQNMSAEYASRKRRLTLASGAEVASKQELAEYEENTGAPVVGALD